MLGQIAEEDAAFPCLEAWGVSESCWVKPWAGDIWPGVRSEHHIGHSPCSASSFDHTQDVCVCKSITHDDIGLKVVKSLRLFWVFLWEGKSYPSDNFHGEIVNLINTRGCFVKRRQGCGGAWLTM